MYAPLRTGKEIKAAQESWPCDIKPRRTGLDYQGRYPELADTYPTAPAALDARPGLHLVDTSDHGAAHAHAGITSDSDADDDAPMGEGAGLLLWPAAVIAACACWALFAFLTSSPL